MSAATRASTRYSSADHEDERERDDVAQSRLHLLEELILAGPLEAVSRAAA